MSGCHFHNVSVNLILSQNHLLMGAPNVALGYHPISYLHLHIREDHQ